MGTEFLDTLEYYDDNHVFLNREAFDYSHYPKRKGDLVLIYADAPPDKKPTPHTSSHYPSGSRSLISELLFPVLGGMNAVLFLNIPPAPEIEQFFTLKKKDVHINHISSDRTDSHSTSLDYIYVYQRPVPAPGMVGNTDSPDNLLVHIESVNKEDEANFLPTILNRTDYLKVIKKLKDSTAFQVTIDGSKEELRSPSRKVVDHHLLNNTPWQKIFPSGHSIFTGEFPKKVRFDHLLRTCGAEYRQLEQEFHHLYADEMRALSAEFTLIPAYQNSRNQTTALLAIPESAPDGGILIIPKQPDTNGVFPLIPIVSSLKNESTEKITILDKPKIESPKTTLPKQNHPVHHNVSSRREALYIDATTSEVIKRNMDFEILGRWGRHEAKAVVFYKHFDELRHSNPTFSIKETIENITPPANDSLRGEPRTLREFLYERDARNIFYGEYRKLRKQFPDIHPLETAARISGNCKKKTVRKYIDQYEKLLCLGTHYASFFARVEQLNEDSLNLNRLQICRQIRKNYPAEFPMPANVYHYHLLQQQDKMDSWESKLG